MEIEMEIKEILNELRYNLPSCLLDLILSFDKFFINDIWNKFVPLIENGDEKQLKQLQKRYHMVRNDTTPVFYIFWKACSHGQLSIVKWFYDIFYMTPQEVKSHDNYAFDIACGNGHLTTAQWFYDTFQITSHDIIKYAFRWACEKGHLSTVQWLHSTFKIASHIVKQNNNYLFCSACRHGQLLIAQWLHFTFKMSSQEDNIINLFRVCAQHGHLLVAQWLHFTFQIMPQEIENQERFLNVTRDNGQLQTVQWLKISFFKI